MGLGSNINLTGHPRQRSSHRTVLDGFILVQLYSILFTVYNCSSEALMLNFTGTAHDALHAAVYFEVHNRKYLQVLNLGILVAPISFQR